jgi:uncharacterized protein (DUF2141 family)
MPALRPTFRPALTALATLAVALAGATVANTAAAATLTLEVQQASGSGELMVAVFNDAGQWLKKPVRAARQPLQDGPLSLQLADLPDGDYAVSLFIDRNANGKLDSNAMGIPTEPYAFSNDAAGNFGPPPFDKAKFTVQGDTRAVIRLP